MNPSLRSILSRLRHPKRNVSGAVLPQQPTLKFNPSDGVQMRVRVSKSSLGQPYMPKPVPNAKLASTDVTADHLEYRHAIKDLAAFLIVQHGYDESELYDLMDEAYEAVHHG